VGGIFRGTEAKRAHGDIVGAGLVLCKLSFEIGEGEEGVGAVEALDVLAVRAFDLAVVARGIGAGFLVDNAKVVSGVFEEGGEITL